MAQPSSCPATFTTTRQSELAGAQLVFGTAAAAVGLFVAVHWIGLPGAHLSLDRNGHRTDSVAALGQAGQLGSRRRAAVDRLSGPRHAADEQAGARKARRGQAGSTTARAAGKPIEPAPVAKRPGEPAADKPPAGGADGSRSTESPPAKQVLPSPPPSPPPPPPVGVPQLPPVPQVPVPTVPDLPKPQVPSIPAPQVPTLP